MSKQDYEFNCRIQHNIEIVLRQIFIIKQLNFIDVLIGRVQIKQVVQDIRRMSKDKKKKRKLFKNKELVGSGKIHKLEAFFT